jgi:RNA polymerase sigma-70 factor (ECF subfamily)
MEKFFFVIFANSNATYYFLLHHSYKTVMAVTPEIIEKCKQNDVKAMEFIYNEYAPSILGICLRYMKDRNSAEDVMQDAFITIFTKINQFEGKGSFEGWMKRIAVNTALMQLRQNKKEFVTGHSVDEVKADLLNSENDTETNVDSPELLIANTEFSQAEIIDAISLLPTGFRTVLNMYVLEGFKHSEISEKLEISIGTSKSQLLRARKKLEEILFSIAVKKQRN